jgi:ribosomal protein S9
MLLVMLKRLNRVHPALLPVEIQRTLQRYKRRVQPNYNRAKPIEIDGWGRARAVGRRKSSHAVVFLVEGDGECLINGRTLVDYFGRLHDRESAVWALKSTQRLDKYNVFAVAKGGGTTGQAEAITLGVAKALLAHEPDLRLALRKGMYMCSLCVMPLCSADFMNSWLYHARYQESGKKEGRQTQGAQDAGLGQAIVFLLCIIYLSLDAINNGATGLTVYCPFCSVRIHNSVAENMRSTSKLLSTQLYMFWRFHRRLVHLGFLLPIPWGATKFVRHSNGKKAPTKTAL